MNSAKFYLATKETLEKVWNMFKVSSKDNKVTKTMSNHKNSSFVNITTSCLANNCFILFEQTKTTDLKETLIIKFSLFNCLCFLVFFWSRKEVVIFDQWKVTFSSKGGLALCCLRKQTELFSILLILEPLKIIHWKKKF